MNKKRILKFFLLLSLFVFPHILWAEVVGKIQYSRGAVTMQSLDGSGARLIEKNETVQHGEVLKTGEVSFTIVKLNDGTLMTIRPNSEFSVEQFNLSKKTAGSTTLRLFRGGVRVITSPTGKRNKYQLKTNVATINTRGAKFDVRLCQDDCESENKKHKKKSKELNVKDAPAGLYVNVVEGSASVKNKSDLKFTLKAGQSAYTDVLGRQNKRLSSAPVFQKFDVYPLPDDLYPETVNLNADAHGVEGSRMLCEIK